MNILLTPRAIEYPESDGLPMADNTRQLDWMTLLYDNLRCHFRERTNDVFVGANQFWYPVEGEPGIRTAPDVYVVFGRPHHHRSSYRQWLENDVPMQFVIEIASPSNNYPEMIDKQYFYEDYGVEEYIIYDPESQFFQAHLRRGSMLRPVRPQLDVYVSERLGGVRFDRSGDDLVVTYPDGQPFRTATEANALRNQAEEQRQQTEVRIQQAEERERLTAARANRLAELSGRLLDGVATADEIAELQRLRQPPSQ